MAAHLAAEHGSELTVIHVVPAFDVVTPSINAVGTAFAHIPTAHDHLVLQDAAATAAVKGVVAKTALLAGSAAESIVAYGESSAADLVVVGSRGHGAVASALWEAFPSASCARPGGRCSSFTARTSASTKHRPRRRSIGGYPMRADIVPGGVFPDYPLPDHEGTARTLSELQGDDPMILTLARGHYCPKEHQQHLDLAAFQPKLAVAYTRIVTVASGWVDRPEVAGAATRPDAQWNDHVTWLPA